MTNATQSFEIELKQLKSMYQSIESEIKKETLVRIGELIMDDKFDEACTVIQQLRELVNVFDFEEKYSETQQAFMKYSENVFKEEDSPAIFQAEQLNHITKSIKQLTPQAEEEEELEPSQANVDWYKQEIKQKFIDRNFQVVQEEGDEIQVRQENKNYHLNYSRPDWTKEEYIKLLNKKCTYKNIGFICRNEEDMNVVRGYTNEWLPTLSDAKKKYLVINYTWPELLEREGKKSFIQTIV